MIPITPTNNLPMKNLRKSQWMAVLNQFQTNLHTLILWRHLKVADGFCTSCFSFRQGTPHLFVVKHPFIETQCSQEGSLSWGQLVDQCTSSIYSKRHWFIPSGLNEQSFLSFSLGESNEENHSSSVDERLSRFSQKRLCVFSLLVIRHTCSIGFRCRSPQKKDLKREKCPYYNSINLEERRKETGHHPSHSLNPISRQNDNSFSSTKENYCFDTLYHNFKEFVTGQNCPCCGTAGKFSRHGKYQKYYYTQLISILRIPWRALLLVKFRLRRVWFFVWYVQESGNSGGMNQIAIFNKVVTKHTRRHPHHCIASCRIVKV